MSVTTSIFAARLLRWYDRSGRYDLPWKREPTPYRVWVAEIMLQQTRVETVIPYYRRFMERFQDLETLAKAPLDDVLRLWSGLGYYSRARNLHKAAEEIVARHGSEFPLSLDEAMSLPGIGRSTAGAILAQAAGQHHSILDGNVKRVLSRYHAIEGYPGGREVEKSLWLWADRHTPRYRVADYTQAIMDLGATICLRRRPRCDLCPQAVDCCAFAENEVERYPTPRPKIHRPLRSTTLLLLRNRKGEILLEKRPPEGIWGGLWSFPECAVDGVVEEELKEWCRQHLGMEVRLLDTLPEVLHGFTHFELRIFPLLLQAEEIKNRVMETRLEVWYTLQEQPPGGLAAPVKRLLEAIS